MSRKKSVVTETIVIAVIIVSLCGVAAILIGPTRFFNWTGANHAKALSGAEDFIAEDPSLQGATSDCTKHDTDGDGNITCTVHGPGDQRLTLECPGRKLIRMFENEGCVETLRYSARLK